jgi:hypothetical protein
MTANIAAHHTNELLTRAIYRLTSALVIFFSNYGFFGSFTEATCRRYYIMSPLFKVLQMAVSQAILGVRAWNLSRRHKGMAIALGALYLLCITLEALMTFVGRVPYRDPQQQNCLPANPPGTKVLLGGAPSYYPVAIAYDICTTVICFYYLVKYKLSTKDSKNVSATVLSVANMMLLDGLVYFIALTAINIVNLIFYYSITSAELQTAAASPGYAFIWILSQNLLIHLHDASSKRRVHSSDPTTITSSRIDTPPHNYESKSRYEFTVPTSGYQFTVPTDSEDYGSRPHFPEPSVQVEVERSVTVHRSEKAYQLEDYSRRSRGGLRSGTSYGCSSSSHQHHDQARSPNLSRREIESTRSVLSTRGES